MEERRAGVASAGDAVYREYRECGCGWICDCPKTGFVSISILFRSLVSVYYDAPVLERVHYMSDLKYSDWAKKMNADMSQTRKFESLCCLQVKVVDTYLIEFKNFCQ